MIDKFEMYTHLYICIDIHVYIVIDTYISIYNWCIIQGMVFNGSTSYHSNTCDKLECPTIYWYKRTIWFVMKHEIKMKPHKYHSISIYLKQLEKGLYDGIAAASLTSQWTSCSRWCSIFFFIWLRRKKYFYTFDKYDKYSYALFFKLTRISSIKMWFRLCFSVRAFIAIRQFFTSFHQISCFCLTWQDCNRNDRNIHLVSRLSVWWLFCQQIHK